MPLLNLRPSCSLNVRCLRCVRGPTGVGDGESRLFRQLGKAAGRCIRCRRVAGAHRKSACQAAHEAPAAVAEKQNIFAAHARGASRVACGFPEPGPFFS